MRDSGQRKLTYSSQNHCTSTLRSGRRKTIVFQTMCAPAERLSQSEIVLTLRKTCYYSPLAEVGVFSTEINQFSPLHYLLFLESLYTRSEMVLFTLQMYKNTAITSEYQKFLHSNSKIFIFNTFCAEMHKLFQQKSIRKIMF